MSRAAQGPFAGPERVRRTSSSRRGADGRVIARASDVGRIELGARDYAHLRLSRTASPPSAMAIFAAPGLQRPRDRRRRSRRRWTSCEALPRGPRYRIVYNPTEFIAGLDPEALHDPSRRSSWSSLVVLLFLQTWRATLIPLVAIPVSLIGTFAVMRCSASRSTCCRCSAWCSRSASSSTTRSSSSRTSSASMREGLVAARGGARDDGRGDRRR